MITQIPWWLWLEHFLAIAGLAWVANWVIELLSLLVGRQRETTKLSRDIQEILKEVWSHEQLIAQKSILSGKQESLEQASSHVLSAEFAAADSAKRQVALARWGSVVAWRLSKSVQHKDLLTEIYARAVANCIQSGSGILLEDVRRITESAAHRQPRPDDVSEALLYDLGAVYFYACRMHMDLMASATITPMLLEEHLKAPNASPEELLNRWRLRVQYELNVYDPAASE